MKNSLSKQYALFYKVINKFEKTIEKAEKRNKLYKESVDEVLTEGFDIRVALKDMKRKFQMIKLSKENKAQVTALAKAYKADLDKMQQAYKEAQDMLGAKFEARAKKLEEKYDAKINKIIEQ